MKKHFVFSILCVLFFCQGEPTELVTTNDGLFRFELPAGWHIEESNPYTVTITQLPPGSTQNEVSVLFLLQFMYRKVTYDEYLEISLTQMKEVYGSVEVLSKCRTSIAGNDGELVELAYSDGGAKLHSICAFTLLGEKALVFTAVTPLDRASGEMRKRLLALLKSLEIRNAEIGTGPVSKKRTKSALQIHAGFSFSHTEVS